LHAQFKLARLFAEDPGVIGTCWFAQRREDPFHILANILRILTHMLLSPCYACIPNFIVDMLATLAKLRRPWRVEFAAMPDAVLLRAPSD
ncbi:hypothetical protein BD410DRAFT_685162, partial [Rickenella mellea]